MTPEPEAQATVETSVAYVSGSEANADIPLPYFNLIVPVRAEVHIDT